MKNLLLILFMMIVTAVYAQEATTQFEQANQLYRSGEYGKAILAYEQIHTNGYESAALYYNLGNAHYKQKDYPAAILNFERARRLSPGDEEITHNLHLANLHVIDKIEPVPQLFIIDWWQGFINLYTTDQWAWNLIWSLCGTVLLGASLLLLRWDLARRLILLTGVLFLLFCVLSCIGMLQKHASEGEQYAIIFSPSVSIKSAPDLQSTDLFVLHEGVRAQVLDTVGDWKKIKLADGKIGWMQAGGLQVI